MAVFVTGSSGFVGLAICEALLAREEHVVGFDIAPPPEAARRAFAALPGAFEAVSGDVRDGEGFAQALAGSGADRLIHLAAVTADAAREQNAPRAIFDVNVGGAIAALEAARRADITRVVHLSSGSVYGLSGRDLPLLDEDATPLRPEGLYGISKQAAEATARRLADLYGIDLVAGRLATCFGRWEYATSVRDTPSAPLQVVLRAMRGENVVLPRPHRRDFLYSRDAAAAVLSLLDAPSPPRRLYNIAAGFIWTLEALCAELAARMPSFHWRLASSDENGAIALYASYDRAPMNHERLVSDTGFIPRFGLHAALDDYLPWLAANADLFTASGSRL